MSGESVTPVTQEPPFIHSLGIARRIQHRMLVAIEWYQHQRTGMVSPCRFFPSCSDYAHEAIHRHGAMRGGLLTVRRLGRCRPFGASGFDPVPGESVVQSACCERHEGVHHV